MANKKEILKNITSYTPEKIADAVRSGIISMYELDKETEGAFTPLLKKRVKELLEQAPIHLVENNKENISEIERSVISGSTTTEPTPTSDELEIAPIAGEESLTTQGSIKNKPGMFRNPFSFSGRIRRTEYAISLIINYVISFFMGVIESTAVKSDTASAWWILYLALFVPWLWLGLAQGVKRCHDRGNSGWYMFIPFYGLWMLFAKGETGTNKYGNSPK